MKTHHDKSTTISNQTIAIDGATKQERVYLGLRGFNEPWLYKCWEHWTNSGVQTGAWRYHRDFGGFVRWFLTT